MLRTVDSYRVRKGVTIVRLVKGLITAVFAAFVAMLLAGCEKEGPAEKAGKAIDEAASEVAEEIKETKEDIEDKMQE